MKRGAKGDKRKYVFSPRLIIISRNNKYINKEIEFSLQ